MKDQLISFETAKLAKEKGFDERTMLHHYSVAILKAQKLGFPYSEDELLNRYGVHRRNSELSKKRYSAPTQSLLQKWLREEHNCIVEVTFHSDSSKSEYFGNKRDILYEVTVDYYGKDFEIELTDEPDFNEYNFKSYEKALEKGLQEALKLIKNQTYST